MHSLTRPEKLSGKGDRLVRHPALRAAGTNVLTKLKGIARIRSFHAGSTVNALDDPHPLVGNVLSGVVKLAKITADGRQQIGGLLFESDFVGLAFENHYSFSAEAATAVEICTFDRKAFERLIKDYRELEHQLLIATLNELDTAREWITLLGYKSAKEKVAGFLLFVARKSVNAGHYGALPGNAVGFELLISRADIAVYLGMTIETVSREITRLKTANIIQLTGIHHFIVPDMDRLAAVAGFDYCERPVTPP